MTIKEIARICGVSRGTVDRVLNNRGKVKPETEALILQTIAEHGYTKNIVGRALTVKKTQPVIGAILCSEGNPFFDDVIDGFSQAEADLKDYGATLILKTMCGHEVARQLALIDELSGHISALVIQPINSSRIAERLLALKEAGVPVVTVNTDIESSSRCCYVGSDYESGGAVAAGMMALVTVGQASIGVIEGVPTLMGHVLRQKGFEDHLLALSPALSIIDRAPALDDPEQAYRATCRMLESHPKIDAMFVVAAGVYDVCRAIIDCGREHSIRVVAYDDVPTTREMMRRGLVRAVVCQQPFDQGYRAVREAFDMLLSGQMHEGRMLIMENQIKIAENID
ncbi:MAG: LacI family DNA-binding transcriptional regulator [Clostridiales bacterium]|nr:LacI family DNA-binding transcriptional regulator [Clostridiales bacterium]